MITLMWEVVATDVDAVVAWARSLRPHGMMGRETYVSEDGRVVLITHWRNAELAAEADLTPPAGSVAREPHVWRFTRVDVTGLRA